MGYLWNVLFSFLFRERLHPQKAGKLPLDMDQFRMLFCTCKVPGVKKDTIRNYFKTGGNNLILSRAFRHTSDSFSIISQFLIITVVFVRFFPCHREWGAVPFPFGGDVSWTDVHIWCSVWWTNPHSSRNTQVVIYTQVQTSFNRTTEGWKVRPWTNCRW